EIPHGGGLDRIRLELDRSPLDPHQGRGQHRGGKLVIVVHGASLSLRLGDYKDFAETESRAWRPAQEFAAMRPCETPCDGPCLMTRCGIARVRAPIRSFG